MTHGIDQRAPAERGARRQGRELKPAWSAPRSHLHPMCPSATQAIVGSTVVHFAPVPAGNFPYNVFISINYLRDLLVSTGYGPSRDLLVSTHWGRLKTQARSARTPQCAFKSASPVEKLAHGAQLPPEPGLAPRTQLTQVHQKRLR